jgi:hypothetical protein
MKKLTTALKTGNLKPKERVMLLFQNDVAKDKTGKEILSPADQHALSKGWRPENNEQAREYNRYIEGWRIAGLAEIDAQTTFLNAQMAHFRKQPLAFSLLLYPCHRKMRMLLKRLEETKRVDIREAMEIVGKQRAVKLQDGLDFEYAVYLLAFESLSDDLRQDLKTLYEEVEYEPQYLDQEEIIANLFNGKNELTKEAKEKLAELVAGNCYNPFAKEYQLYHYFACIPLAEVALHFLTGKGIAINGKALAQNQETDDEDDATHEAVQKAAEQYAKDHGTTIEAMLKDACLKWLDEGLLTQEYVPLCNSDNKETVNDADTKVPHKEILREWLKAKKKAEQILQELIDNGKLKVIDTPPSGDIDEKWLKEGSHKEHTQLSGDKTITGESLYGFKSDWAFVKDFKERVDRYDSNLGIVYADDDPGHKGDHLDQELLLADKNKDGELNIFSMFGVTAQWLSALLEGETYFEEIEKDGETILAFKNAGLEEAFIGAKDDLVEGYATLLSFAEIFKRLSKAYEIDLSYKIKRWLDTLEEYMNDHNEAVNRATGQTRDGDKESFVRIEPPLKIDSALFIDEDAIKPNKKRTGRHHEELEKIFGSEF